VRRTAGRRYWRAKEIDVYMMLFERRVIAGLSLLAIASCSLIDRGKATVPGVGTTGTAAVASGGAAPAKVAGPTVKADQDDSPDVSRAVARLEAMERMIADKQFAKYADESADFQGYLTFRKGLAGETKRDAIKTRLDALDAAAIAGFGGRLRALGDGHRVLKLTDGDAVEAASAVIAACRAAAGMDAVGRGPNQAEVTKRTAEYEKAIARAVKLDAEALHYMGPTRSDSVDVPSALLRCEARLVALTLEFGDEYAAETAPDAGSETGCGEIDWLAEAVRIGDGKFAGYTRSAGGNTALERIACNKIPARGNASKVFADSIASFSEHVDVPLNALVIVLDGKPTTEVNQSDLHTYRYQKLRAYSKQFKFAKNPCGEPKLFCEAGGSQTAAAYNRLEFRIERAEAHAGVRPEMCKEQLEEAKAQAKWFEGFYDEARKSGSWVAGATYRTKKGARLEEKALVAAFADKAKLADDRLTERYCSKPAQPAQPVKPAR
jgi:hypothetical protein